MIPFFSRLLILSSVLVFGYSAARLIDSYGSLQKKILEFRKILLDIDEPTDGLRRSNVIQNAVLTVAYATIAYLAGFAPWVLCVVLLKFSLSCYYSDRFHRVALTAKADVPRPLFIQMKIDALSNIMLCAFVLVLVFA